MTDGSGTETRTYDAVNELTNVTRSSSTFAYVYDQRRGWDSNPRGLRPNGFQDRPVRPLRHPAGDERSAPYVARTVIVRWAVLPPPTLRSIDAT